MPYDVNEDEFEFLEGDLVNTVTGHQGTVLKRYHHTKLGAGTNRYLVQIGSERKDALIYAEKDLELQEDDDDKDNL